MVTVCIPAYQAEGFIDRTLECARRQTHRKLRILASVDAGDDGTIDRCRGHAAEDPRVEVIAHRERMGWAGNVNFLLDEISSEFGFIYFHDDLIDEHYCERLVAALDRRPDAASAHCDVGHFPDSERIVPGCRYEGAAVERLLGFLITQPRPSLLRSMLRTSVAGHIRAPIDAAGIWAGQTMMAQLVSAGPVLHVPEVLYRRWDQREGGLTHGWRRLPFERVVAGARTNAEAGRDAIDALDPTPGERELLVFGLWAYMTLRLRRAEARHGVTALTPPETLLEDFAGMRLPAAASSLPVPLRVQCARAYEHVRKRTGRRALEVGDHEAARACFSELAERDPLNPVYWMQLSRALRGLGRRAEAKEARRRGRELKRESAPPDAPPAARSPA